MIAWHLKKFNDLLPAELYSIMEVRQLVFVVEQKCAYLDADGKDAESHHLMGINEANKLVAYARILPAGLSYKEASIGRVVTHPDERTKGYGKALMEEAVKQTEELFGKVPIRIGAQRYLLRFYESFGFVKGEDYMEDGIPHSIMIRKGI